jgi:hypothetical protein
VLPALGGSAAAGGHDAAGVSGSSSMCVNRLSRRRLGRVGHVLIGDGGQRRRAPGVLGVDDTSAEDGQLASALSRPHRPRLVRGVPGHLRCPRRAWPAALGATLPGASWQRRRTHYPANPMAITPTTGLGESAAALGLRPTRRCQRARPVVSDLRPPSGVCGSDDVGAGATDLGIGPPAAGGW